MNALGPKQFINSICDMWFFLFTHRLVSIQKYIKKAYYDNEKKNLQVLYVSKCKISYFIETDVWASDLMLNLSKSAPKKKQTLKKK